MSRFLSLGVALSVAGTAIGAQQAPLPQTSNDPVPVVGQLTTEQQKDQVRSFAAVLKSAVEGGGQRLQKRVIEEVPTAPPLAMAGVVDVLGAPHPDGGFVFSVQVPDIQGSFLPIFILSRNKTQGARPVATNPPVGTNPVVPEDSVKPVDFDPDREYGEFVRAGLIEAMIENSQGLAISEGRLVVIASVSAVVRRDPLDTSRLLILSIKGEDLAAYRQGRITRDEVRLRVIDRRF